MCNGGRYFFNPAIRIFRLSAGNASESGKMKKKVIKDKQDDLFRVVSRAVILAIAITNRKCLKDPHSLFFFFFHVICSRLRARLSRRRWAEGYLAFLVRWGRVCTETKQKGNFRGANRKINIRKEHNSLVKSMHCQKNMRSKDKFKS